MSPAVQGGSHWLLTGEGQLEDSEGWARAIKRVLHLLLLHGGQVCCEAADHAACVRRCLRLTALAACPGAVAPLQEVFEIGRRHKVMNPEKMRSEYGKLMYMLMDSADRNVQVRAAKGGGDAHLQESAWVAWEGGMLFGWRMCWHC